MSQRDPLRWIDGFVASVEDCSTAQGVRDMLRKHTQALGFEKFSYQRLLPPTGRVEKFYVSTYPREWIVRYNECRYLSVDVRSLASSRFARPYNWSEIGPLSSFTLDQMVLINEGTEFGIISGGSVPIHGPGDIRAVLTVASSLPETEFGKLFAAQRHVLHLMATYAHEHLVRLGFWAEPDMHHQLTPREVEVLTWSARGKTNRDISNILKISDETVMTHVKRICAKLDASNKTHAVARALALKLILP
jgi:LuxR family transcriptional regulator, activator of conjugal transfer of Ti plasmids